MFIALFLLSIFTIIISAKEPQSKFLAWTDGSSRIVDGIDTTIEEWPYMVSLRGYFRDNHNCGGIAIHPLWVLTAAHCTLYGTPESYTIQHSSTQISPDATNEYVVGVTEIINQEHFLTTDELIHDISLLRLERPLNLTKYAILPNQFDDIAHGTPSILIGWGLNDTFGSIQQTLQRADLIVFSDEECERRHDTPSRPRPSNICSGVPDGGRGQCSGDSGGPLFVNGITVGIVSWSIKPCAVYPYPGVYTQISYYREWIRQRSGV